MKYTIALIVFLTSVKLNAQNLDNQFSESNIDTVQYEFTPYSFTELEHLTNTFYSKINLINENSGIYTDLLFYNKNFKVSNNSKFIVEYYETNRKGKLKRYSKDKFKSKDNMLRISSAKIFKLYGYLPVYYLYTFDTLTSDSSFQWVNKKGEYLSNNYSYNIYKKDIDSIIEIKKVNLYMNFPDSTYIFIKEIYTDNLLKKYSENKITKNSRTGTIDTNMVFNIYEYPNPNEIKNSYYKVLSNDTIYKGCRITTKEFNNKGLLIFESTKSYKNDSILDSETKTVYEYNSHDLLISEKHISINKNGRNYSSGTFYEYKNDELIKETQLQYSKNNKVLWSWINTYSNGYWTSTLIQEPDEPTVYFFRKL